MELSQKIITARKKKGLTQDQLADLTNVTVRTIQRIESGESNPRPYTIKAIAAALDTPFEEWTADSAKDPSTDSSGLNKTNEGKEFLQLVALSCFSYIVIPFVHFLVPTRLLNKSTGQNTQIVTFAKRIIRVQIYWTVALHLLMLMTLAYNLVWSAYFEKTYVVSYLLPFFLMYFLNAVIIATTLLRISSSKISFLSKA